MAEQNETQLNTYEEPYPTQVAAGGSRVAPDGSRSASPERTGSEVGDAARDMEPERDPLDAEDPTVAEGLTEAQGEGLQPEAPRPAEDISNQPASPAGSDDDGEDTARVRSADGATQEDAPNGGVQKAAVDDMFDSDEDLSDLDEEQFRDMDTAAVDNAEPAIYALPSFKKRGAGGAAERRKQKRSRTTAGGDGAGDGSDSEDGKIYSDDERPRKKAGRNEPPPKPEDPVLAERWEMDRLMDRALAPSVRRRNKADEEDLEMKQDEGIARLTDRMREAAAKDAEANVARKVATAKLRMIGEVEAALKAQRLAESILENGMLTSVRYWLEPLPDHSLPSLDIQRVLFAALDRLPIKTEHLRESGVGKVVLFYRKSRKPEHEIKILAEKLILRWSRPILKKSHDYRTRQIETRDVARPNGGMSLNRSLANARAEAAAAAATGGVMYKSKGGTVIPRGQSTYAIAPRSRELGSLAARQGAERAGGEGSDAYRHLRRTLKGMSGRGTATGKSKSGVSIEGRGIA